MNARLISLARMAAVAAAATVALGACGGSSDDAAESSVENAWARTSPMSSENGAAYFTITSDETDALIAVSVDPEIAAEAQIHETSMVDGHDESMDEGMEEMDDMESGGEVMQMVHLERLDLPAGETVELAPGGYHIMLLDLAEPLASGDSFELTLDFETADDTVITVAVSDTAPE